MFDGYVLLPDRAALAGETEHAEGEKHEEHDDDHKESATEEGSEHAEKSE